MKTARELILDRLALADSALAVHQIRVPTVSDTSCSARLRELAREGLVFSSPVKGKRFTVWSLVPKSDYGFKEAQVQYHETKHKLWGE